MFSIEKPPTVKAYVNALNQVELSENDVRILRFQFSQPGRSMTTKELSQYMYGRSRVAPSNGAYGRLAGKLVKSVGFRVENSRRPGNWRAIAVRDSNANDSRWIMRDEFADALVETGVVEAYLDGAKYVPADVDGLDGFAAMEGGGSLRLHLCRERSKSLIKRKKKSAKSLECEVCKFDAQAFYGVDYCEVHHLVPVSSLEETTRITLEDLAIVCASCHRIIHKRHPEPYQLDEVRKMIRRKHRRK